MFEKLRFELEKLVDLSASFIEIYDEANQKVTNLKKDYDSLFCGFDYHVSTNFVNFSNFKDTLIDGLEWFDYTSTTLESKLANKNNDVDYCKEILVGKNRGYWKWEDRLSYVKSNLDLTENHDYLKNYFCSNNYLKSKKRDIYDELLDLFD